MKNRRSKLSRGLHEPRMAVSLTIDEAPLLKDIVEKLAHRSSEGNHYELMIAGWEPVETSSIEAYVSGNMDLFGEDDHICTSYTTCFSFTCTRLPDQENTLSWVNSLS